MGGGLVGWRELPVLEVAVSEELERGGVGGSAVLEDDPRAAFLVDGHRAVVEGGVEPIDLRLREVLHLGRLLHMCSETDFFRVRAAEVQDAGEDPDDLPFRSTERIRETASVEFEGVQPCLGKLIRFAKLDRSVLERLREEDRGDGGSLHDDGIASAKHLENEVVRVAAAFELEHGYAVIPSLLYYSQPRVVEEPS